MTFTRTHKTLAVIALAFAGAAVLTGCAPEPPESTETPIVSPSPTPTETTEPVAGGLVPEGAQTGTEVDAETAAELNENAYLPSKPRAYPMPDGRHILLLPGDELPQEVVEVVEAELDQAATTTTSADPVERAQADAQLLEAADEQKQLTGKTPIYVLYYPHDLDGNVWGVSPPVSEAFPTKEAAIAAAEQLIGASPDSYLTVIIE